MAEGRTTDIDMYNATEDMASTPTRKSRFVWIPPSLKPNETLFPILDLLCSCIYRSVDDMMYNQWLAWQDTSGVTRSEEVPADGLSGINKTDLPKYIENYATMVQSNLEMAEMVKIFISLPCSCTRTHSLKLEELNTLRCRFEKACQGMHKHYTNSFDGDALVDIFYKLQEVNIFTVELLQNAKNVTDFCKQLHYTDECDIDRFINRILGPIIRNVKDSIFKFYESMQASFLKCYAASIIYDIISIIIALLLFICCQSSLGSATDMKQLMIFATVIHLIISGDVESNPGPGPEYDARDLYKKEPEVDDFQRIFIQSGAACHWQIIGRALGVKVDDLINSPLSAADKIGVVHKKWSDKHQDFTWERLIEACEGYDEFGRVRDAIDTFLSSDKAHKKYRDEPDFESKRSRRSENDYSNKRDNGPVTTINVHVHIPTSVLLFIIVILCGVIIYQWIDNRNC